MPYVNFRWLGGMLTNFQTVHARVAKMHELDRMVTSGETEQMIKKEGLKLKRERDKLERNLGGIRRLEKLPDAIFVIDTKKEHIAVTEANRLGHPGGRGRRHELRPRPHRLRDPRQRRRDPFGQPDVPDHRRRRRRGEVPRAAARGAVRAPRPRTSRRRSRRCSRRRSRPTRDAEQARGPRRSGRGPARARGARSRPRRPRSPRTTEEPAADAARGRGRRPTTDATETSTEKREWLTSARRTSPHCARRPAPG